MFYGLSKNVSISLAFRNQMNDKDRVRDIVDSLSSAERTILKAVLRMFQDQGHVQNRSMTEEIISEIKRVVK